MKIGIIGLQGSGKTTVFETMMKESGLEMKYGSYGDEKLKPHVGTICVHDERLVELSKIYNPKKTTFAELAFIDRPGFDIVNVKEADALVLVVGAFLGRNSIKDINDVDAELIISDLSIVQNKLKKLDKELKSGKVKRESEIEHDLLLKCEKLLEDGVALRDLVLDEAQDQLSHGYQFLTRKPILVVLNIDENDLGKPPQEELEKSVLQKGSKLIELCAKIELEIQDLDENERPEFLSSLGIDEPAIDKVIKVTFEMLNLISFFTVRGEEVKAWTVKKETKAVDAAGKIHTDMKRGFIRAEVVNYKDFMECAGSLQAARKKGYVRLEGRNYPVKDGDIIDFRFNV